jgi:hypothetical protein
MDETFAGLFLASLPARPRREVSGRSWKKPRREPSEESGEHYGKCATGAHF